MSKHSSSTLGAQRADLVCDSLGDFVASVEAGRRTIAETVRQFRRVIEQLWTIPQALPLGLRKSFRH